MCERHLFANSLLFSMEFIDFIEGCTSTTDIEDNTVENGMLESKEWLSFCICAQAFILHSTLLPYMCTCTSIFVYPFLLHLKMYSLLLSLIPSA